MSLHQSSEMFNILYELELYLGNSDQKNFSVVTHFQATEYLFFFFILIFHKMCACGHAVAQAVCWWIPTVTARV
jgi:hypothetical protein